MLELILKQLFVDVFKKLYRQEPPVQNVSFQKTRPEFEGDVTIVVFPFVKMAGKAPEVLANELGTEMMRESVFIAKYNVVKGFLNLLISDTLQPSRLLRIWPRCNGLLVFGDEYSTTTG